MKHVVRVPVRQSGGQEPQEEAVSEDVLVLDRSADAETQLQQARKLIETLRDDKLRLIADRENYRKRIKKAYETREDEAHTDLLLNLLSVLDNLERALSYARPDDGLSEGVELTRRQLLDILHQEGVEPIEAIGAVFDPAFHEAVGVAAGYPRSGIVVDEKAKGYMYKGKVLRPSRVVVSSAETGSSEG